MESNSFGKSGNGNSKRIAPYNGTICTKWEYTRRLMERWNVGYDHYEAITQVIFPNVELSDKASWDEKPVIPDSDMILFDYCFGRGLVVMPSEMSKHSKHYLNPVKELESVLESKSELLNLPLKTEDIAEKVKAEFGGALDLFNINYMYGYLEITLKQFLQRKLEFFKTVKMNFETLTNLSEEELIDSLYFSENTMENLVQRMLASSDNFSKALLSVCEDLKTQQEQRAYLYLLSNISYYIKEVGDDQYWKDFVRVIADIKKKES